MKFGVVTFPGSNCDYDAFAAVRHVLGEDVEFLWHKSSDLMGCDVIILLGRARNWHLQWLPGSDRGGAVARGADEKRAPSV
jgi:hypothetical protein